MNSTETVQDRQVHSGLREIASGIEPPDLTDRILDRWQEEQSRPQPGAGRTRLAAAAAIVFGSAIVLAVASGAFDPEPAPVTPTGGEQFRTYHVARVDEIEALPVDARSVVVQAATDADLTALAKRCPELWHLSLGGFRSQRATTVTDTGMREIGRLSKLRSLDMSRATKITDRGLRELETLPTLRSLTFGGALTTSIDFAVLGRIPSLVELDLSTPAMIENEDLAHVVTLTGLQKLSLANWPMAKTDLLEKLGELDDLRVLDLDNVTGTPRSRSFRDRTRREGYGVTDDVLARLAKLPRLESLGIAGCEVSNVAIRNLADQRRLTAIDVSYNKAFDDATLSSILDSCALRVLHIDRCDALTAEVLPALLRETTLETLHMSVLWSTEDVQRDLREKLPKLRELKADPPSLKGMRRR